MLLTDSVASSFSSCFSGASTGDVTAEVPDGGVGRAGVGTGSGTKGSRGAIAACGARNAVKGAGDGWTGGGATGEGGTGISGRSVEGGAEPAGEGAGCKGGIVIVALAGISFSRVVPHGLRTLPA